GNSRAWHSDSNPFTPWWPSQNGLLSENPQRQSEMTVRPAKPNSFPSISTIVKSPSIRIGPLLITVTFAAAIGGYRSIPHVGQVVNLRPIAMPVHTLSPRFCFEIAQARSTNEI